MSHVSTRAYMPAQDLPKPGRYRHFKGGEYEVLEVARHTETGDLLAVYRSVDEPETMWVRPVEMFSETVERPDGTFLRFQPTSGVNEQDGSGRLGRIILRAAIALLNRSGRGNHEIVVIGPGSPVDAPSRDWNCGRNGAMNSEWALKQARGKLYPG